MPLELQKLAYLRFTEGYVRTIVDMMSVDYGLREVQSEENGEITTTLFDFSTGDGLGMHMKVDIGSAAYWSELMQVQTMDNLFAKGIITDVLTYLDGIPEQYLRNKSKIIAKIKNSQAALPPMGAMPAAMPEATGAMQSAAMPPMPTGGMM